MRNRILALAVVGACATAALAQEMVDVPGSHTQYPTPVETRIGDQPVTLVLTGTALRKKYFFNVYAIGSYIQAGVSVQTAEELAALDVPKQLRLVMERDVESKDMAEAFRAAIRLNYPEPAFANELATLTQALQGLTFKKGDHVRLSHVPKIGLRIDFSGQGSFQIANVAFARAVWEIYLGKNNIDEQIKRRLVYLL
jgi:hypothetical protein